MTIDAIGIVLHDVLSNPVLRIGVARRLPIVNGLKVKLQELGHKEDSDVMSPQKVFSEEDIEVLTKPQVPDYIKKYRVPGHASTGRTITTNRDGNPRSEEV